MFTHNERTSCRENRINNRLLTAGELNSVALYTAALAPCIRMEQRKNRPVRV